MIQPVPLKKMQLIPPSHRLAIKFKVKKMAKQICLAGSGLSYCTVPGCSSNFAIPAFTLSVQSS